MANALEQTFAEIDRQAAAALRPVSKIESLTKFVAAHRRMARKVITDAKANRAWLKKIAKTNAGVTRFYGENLDLVSSSLARHRQCIARARAELRALSVVQLKEAA